MTPPTAAANTGTKALDGVKVLDMTHVQSGPSCTQLLGWLGAEIIKVELPGRGDITRQQLQDIPGVDSLYFTMLNSNKRSITLNTKTAQGKEIFTALIRHCDVLVENFAPGVLDRQGFTWERVHEINPRIVYASIKGFGPGGFAEAKAYEPIAQAMGGSMSTTGFIDGPPLVTGSQIGDSGTGIHTVAAILAALYQRDMHTQEGQRVECAMQDSVLNLCRVKMRDQQRSERGPLVEYPNQPTNGAVPRTGNASGGGHPGAALRCAPGGENDYVYMILQPQIWEPLCKQMDRPELIDDPDFATPEARVKRLPDVFHAIEEWTMKHSKFEVFELCNAIDVPVGPILGMNELLEDESLRARGMIAKIEHPTRGSYFTVGSPLTLSASPVDYRPSPLLGEHSEEILAEIMGYDHDQVENLRSEGVI